MHLYFSMETLRVCIIRFQIQHKTAQQNRISNKARKRIFADGAESYAKPEHKLNKTSFEKGRKVEQKNIQTYRSTQFKFAVSSSVLFF